MIWPRNGFISRKECNNDRYADYFRTSVLHASILYKMGTKAEHFFSELRKKALNVYTNLTSFFEESQTEKIYCKCIQPIIYNS